LDASGAGKRVLVVDDEEFVRLLVAQILGRAGYELDFAADGEAALARVEAWRPDLVILDLMMPGMNGWEFRAAQQGDPDLSQIPVIVLSALGRVSGLDAAEFLQKPFELAALLTAVHRHAKAA
jgi:two-component system, OmpR family, alkaline phosphatase synthesis response regulator PhoP